MFRRIIISIYILLLVVIFFTRPFDGNGDFYHHINTGKYILEHHSLPYFDNLTFTRNGQPWIAYAWGSGLILYLIFTHFGPWGIAAWTSGMALITLLLLYKLLRTFNVSVKYSLLLLTLASAPMAIRWPSRPELFTYPFIILVLLIDRLKQSRPKLVWLYPLIFLAWANLYGSSTIMGLILLGLLTCKQFVSDKFRILESKKNFYLNSLLSLIVSFINGYGSATIFYIILIKKVATYEGEWASISTILRDTPIGYLITSQYLVTIYLLFLIVYLLLLALSVKNIMQNKFLALISLAAFAPFLTFRHTPLAAILVLPLMGVLLIKRSAIVKNILIGSVFCVTAISLIIFLWLKPLSFAYDNSAIQALTDFISQNKLSGRAFNYQTVGGYLSYHFYPQILVFYDTRDDLFLDSAIFNDLYSTLVENKSVLPLLDKYHADLVVGDIFTDSLNYRDLFYSPQWALVYFNDRYFIIVRTSIAKEKKLTVLDFIDPYSSSTAKGGLEKKAEAYYLKLIRENPKSFNDKAYLASILLAQQKYDEVLKVAPQLKAEPGPVGALFQKNIDFLLANVFLGKNDCQEAKIYLDKTASDIRNKILFQSDILLPSNVNQKYAFYYIQCEDDAVKAQDYLEKFLAQPEVTPLEKIETEQRFSILKSKK